jgi:hypothetical protein
MEMRAGFLVNYNSIRASFLKGLEVSLRLNNHEVHIEECFRARFQRLDDVSSEGDGGNERTVHHIHVKPISASGDHIIDFLSKPRNISGENRRGDNN